MENKPERSKPTEKLNMDERNEKRPFVHYRGLKLCERQGMRVISTHSVN